MTNSISMYVCIYDIFICDLPRPDMDQISAFIQKFRNVPRMTGIMHVDTFKHPLSPASRP